MLTIHSDKRLSAVPLQTHRDMKLIVCVAQCIRMNYAESGGECELLDGGDYTVGASDWMAVQLLPVLQDNLGWQFLSPN